MVEQLGIDLSSLAGNKRVNWPVVKEAGYDFAILRASWGTWEDPEWDKHREAIRDARMVLGAYMFPRLEMDVAPQISEFIKDIRLQPGDIPPIVDLEGITKKGIHPDVAVARTVECVERLKQAYGVQPWLYTSERVCRQELRDHPDLRKLKDCPLWLARYVTPRPGYNPPIPIHWGGSREPRNWYMHQYAGNVAKVPGLSGKVDLNRWQGMQYGSAGARVATIQRLLKVPADGLFGRQTADALGLYQVTHGLVPTGWLNVETYARLAWETK